MWAEEASVANMVLEETMERIYVGHQYGDIPRGVYLIRGENVVLYGEVVGFFHYGRHVTCHLTHFVGHGARDAVATATGVHGRNFGAAKD